MLGLWAWLVPRVGFLATGPAVFSHCRCPDGANCCWRGWPFTDCSHLLGWTGAGSCSAPPTHPTGACYPLLHWGEGQSVLANTSFVAFISLFQPQQHRKLSQSMHYLSSGQGLQEIRAYYLHKTKQTHGWRKTEMLEKQEITYSIILGSWTQMCLLICLSAVYIFVYLFWQKIQIMGNV